MAENSTEHASASAAPANPDTQNAVAPAAPVTEAAATAELTAVESEAEAAALAAEGAEPDDNGEQKVAFHSGFFNKLQMSYFRFVENTTEPVLMVEYGSQTVSLPLPGIRRELHLTENDHDWKMLDLIVKGLKYVNTLAVGDPLPSEITTGKASWALTPQHAQVAYQRLALKLMAWMTQDKVDTSTAVHAGEDILKQAQDPEVRKKISAAFDEAAEALGIGRDRREDVVGYLERLAQELGYIEALRERFARIVKVGRRLRDYQAIGKKGGGQRVADVIDQAARLMRPAVDQLVQFFKDTDALTQDILAVLKDLDGHIVAIQTQRDEIHQRLNPWYDIIEAWEKVKDQEITAQVVEAAARTVRMLAPRFMPTKEWVLRLRNDQERKSGQKSWRTPDQMSEDARKMAARTMRW